MLGEVVGQTDLIERAKTEYLKGDLVMSELLRNEEFYGLSNTSQAHLLAWAGEDDYETGRIELGRVDASIKSNVDEMIDQKFKKALRIIKKIRWQDHYNTRKRSRRF